MSLTIDVPPAVPSVLQSSVPNPSTLAVKYEVAPTCKIEAGLEEPVDGVVLISLIRLAASRFRHSSRSKTRPRLTSSIRRRRARLVALAIAFDTVSRANEVDNRVSMLDRHCILVDFRKRARSG